MKDFKYSSFLGAIRVELNDMKVVSDCLQR